MNTRYRVDRETIRLRAGDDAGEVLLEVAQVGLAAGAGSTVAARGSRARSVCVGQVGSSSSSSSAAAMAGDAGHGMAAAAACGRRRHGLRSSD